MKTLCITLLVMTAAATDASAQSAPSVGEGSRVRIVTTDHARRVFGTIVSQDEGSLKLLEYPGGPTVTVPRNAIASMDVGVKGKSQAGKGALIGFLVMATAVMLTPEQECTTIVCIEIPKELAAAALGGLSAGLGALIGASIHSVNWVPVESGVRVAVVPARKGGVFRLSIAF